MDSTRTPLASFDRPPMIFLSAGETSGDLYASLLVNALRTRITGPQFHGIGGEEMAKAGVHLTHHLRDFSVMGLTDVLVRLRHLHRIFHAVFAHIIQNNPAAIILIDFPDFNLRLARKIAMFKQRLNQPYPILFYYVTPQVWIWRKRRIRDLRHFCNFVIPIFDFEHELFQREGLRSFFAGHPINDVVRKVQYDQKITENQVVLGLLPGSRNQEVRRILPVMLEAAVLFTRSYRKSCRILVSQSSHVDPRLYDTILRRFPSLDAERQTDVQNVLSVADLLLAKSGTVNLQIAFFRKPVIIVYKTSFLTWLVARFVLRIRRISLLNILGERDLVHEYIQFDARPAAIAKTALELLEDKTKRVRMLDGMDAIVQRIRTSNVSSRVADFVTSHLQKKSRLP